MKLLNAILSPFRKICNWVKKKKYYFLTAFLIVFTIWLFCLPSTLFNNPTCTVLLDNNDNLIGARIAEDGQWRFPPRYDVPEKFKKAIIQFEDRDFYSHMGFSFKAFGRAMKQNISAGKVVSGGSTISMQTIRLSRDGKGRTLWEKLIEVFQATRMEWSYSKEEILAIYASNAPMGGNVVGLDAAAWRYFGRGAEDLSWAESATLAVLPNAPSLMHPGKNREKLIAKRNRLLDRLFEVGEIDSIELLLAKSEPLPDKPAILPNYSPHLIDRAIKEKMMGKTIHSTIDYSFQDEVVKIVDFHHSKLKENEIHNAAVVVLDVESGNVIAYVGNTKGKDVNHGYDVDIITAPRSTGSILKPFLYGGALDAGTIMPKELIEDVPTLIAGYSPKNYNEKYDGAVPASRALSRSLNVPIVKLLQDYGVQKFHRQLNRMGMTTVNRPSSDYGLSLILGGAEANLWDLTAIYMNMARTLNSYAMGEKAAFLTPSYIQSGDENRETDNLLLSPAATWETFQAMMEVARPEVDGNWEQFSSSQKIAWKTGTSFGFRDAWAIGVTSRFVVGVWVGNADGEGRPGLVGVRAAAPIMFDVFKHLPKSDWFSQPYDKMQLVPVCAKSGCRASQICDHVDSVWVPVTCLNTLPCPYHQVIHTDKNGKRVNSSCEEVSNMQEEVYFVLPPVMERFYRYKNPNYKQLPPYRSDCENEETSSPLGLIYPKNKSVIYIPVKLDGSLSKTIFEASHRNDTINVYWHIDEQFIGVTKRIHQFELVPAIGTHTLTLIDENGNEISRMFEVVGKE